VFVEVAADRKPVTQARTAFGRETAIFLVALWFALAIAAWVQVRMGLRPLNRIREELDAMSRAVDARLDVAAHPIEIRPLTQAINMVAERRGQDIIRARQRARDLAHALKTPITSLRLQVETLPAGKAGEMMHGLSLIVGAVERELARTGASSEGESVDASAVIQRLLAVVARTPDGKRLSLHNGLPSPMRVPMGLEPALEAFGAILENAARHAQTNVDVLGGMDQQSRWLEVRDDGPGIAEDLRSLALTRGARLDEGGKNQGLGLSIAQEIVLASGGILSLASASPRGLSVRLEWPPEKT
jgi:signal transduction histidine kinase